MSLGMCVCLSLSLFCGIFLLTTWARLCHLAWVCVSLCLSLSLHLSHDEVN